MPWHINAARTNEMLAFQLGKQLAYDSGIRSVSLFLMMSTTARKISGAEDPSAISVSVATVSFQTLGGEQCVRESAAVKCCYLSLVTLTVHLNLQQMNQDI